LGGGEGTREPKGLGTQDHPKGGEKKQDEKKERPVQKYKKSLELHGLLTIIPKTPPEKEKLALRRERRTAKKRGKFRKIYAK